jgi:hypothetical protein
MRAFTITAILAALIAIPFMKRRRHLEAAEVKPEFGGRLNGDDLRYDIDDFLS